MADPPAAPSLPWRIASSTVMGLVGASVRTFMFGLNSTETHGLDNFLELLDKRKDIDKRERGLITGKRAVGLLLGLLLIVTLEVSNHICVYVRIPFLCHPLLSRPLNETHSQHR